MSHSRPPERVLQFGEGRFLRGFADWMIHGANRCGVFGGSVVALNNTARGSVEPLLEADCRFDVLLRGYTSGRAIERRDPVASISRAINPYRDWTAVLEVARQPDIRFIISNTTEAGIVFDAQDSYSATPPSSFPGKLTRLLHERFRTFSGHPDRGWMVLPCELIENNGGALRETVLRLAEAWRLEPEFHAWVLHSNLFANTLVDRIVSGHPGGDEPPLTVAAEPYHLWAIEARPESAAQFPLADAGYNVVWTEQLAPYRERKVRLLNGAHTVLAPAAYLAGKRTVLQCMEDPVTRGFVDAVLHQEIIPTVELPREELERFAASVLERFSNPFLRHELRSIALNSVAKFRARVLPSLRRRPGERLSLALAALIEFYRTCEPVDDPVVLEDFRQLFSASDDPERTAERVLSKAEWWGTDLRDLPELLGTVANYLRRLHTEGSYSLMAELAGSVK